MSNGELDRLPVNQLSERYNLARSAVYTRLKALGIEQERVGGKAYVNAEQLQLLDALHSFIRDGGTIPEFVEMRGLRKPEQESSEQSSGLSTIPADLVRLAAGMAAELVNRLQPPAPPTDPLAYFDKLEKACQHGWLLRTSEVADLLDLDPSEIRLYGDSFSEAGFTFTNAGFRAGGEVAWRVSKPVK